MGRETSFISAAVVFLAALTPAGAAVIEYNANPGPAPDPTAVDGYPSKPGNQPWAYYTGGGSYFSAIDDGGTPAWAQNTLGTNTYALYQMAVDLADANDAMNLGWAIEATVRLPSANNPVTGGIMLGGYTHYRNWYMVAGTDGNADPVVGLWDTNTSGLTYYVLSGGAGAYHTYRLVYDPVAGTADMFVDGNEVISDWLAGNLYPSPTSPYARFGDSDGTAGHDGAAYYNFMQWVVVPEPATMALITFGALGLLARRRRVRR
jgi:hypothetical protein